MPSILPSKVIVGSRFRKSSGNLNDLKKSIASIGLLNPITLDKESNLVAGFRRLEAWKALYGDERPIPYSLFTRTSTKANRAELEENTIRKDFTWQERNAAIADHREKTGSSTKTASALGISVRSVNQHKQVRENFDLVKDKPTFMTALETIQRSQVRKERRGVETIINAIVTEEPEGPTIKAPNPSPPPPPTTNLINDDFVSWAREYKGPRFDVVHCDFPYGINLEKKETDRKSQALKTFDKTYDDSFEIYDELLTCLIRSNQKLLAIDSWIIFWFSPKNLEFTKQKIEKHTDWKIDPFPFIWDRTPLGVLPSTRFHLRRNYEMALIISKGSPEVVKNGGNIFRDNMKGRVHPSEKPRAMLKHLLSNFIEEGMSFLDPTFGSGNSILVAKDLKALPIFGVEQDKEYFERFKEEVDNE